MQITEEEYFLFLVLIASPFLSFLTSNEEMA